MIFDIISLCRKKGIERLSKQKVTNNGEKSMLDTRDAGLPSSFGDGSIMLCHKVLKQKNQIKRELSMREMGISADHSNPMIAFNLNEIVSVQEDFCGVGGAIIIDTNNNIVLVQENVMDIIECWAEYKASK